MTTNSQGAPSPAEECVLFHLRTMGRKVLGSDRTDLHFRKFTPTATVVRMRSDRSDIKGKRECIYPSGARESLAQSLAQRGRSGEEGQRQKKMMSLGGSVGRAVWQQEMLSSFGGFFRF